MGRLALDFTPYGTLMELPEEMAEKVREENYEPTYGALEYEDKMYGIRWNIISSTAECL